MNHGLDTVRYRYGYGNCAVTVRLRLQYSNSTVTKTRMFGAVYDTLRSQSQIFVLCGTLSRLLLISGILFDVESDLAAYPIDLDYFDECKKRVTLARKIDETEHQLNKDKNTSSWYEKQAKMLDIELDDEILKETDQDKDQTSKKRRELTRLKQQLESQLKSIIFPKNCSRSYLHSDSYSRIKSVNREF